MSAVRWGLLGTARINRRLIPAMRAVARSTVVAVASREGARAEQHARDWDIPAAVTGYQALLDREDIDAVYIPLPNSLHAEWVLAAIAAGKHVLCEKPLVVQLDDIARIARAAQAAGVTVEEGVMYRHEPLTREVTQLIADGAVGAVRAIVSGFTYAQGRAGDIRLDAALGGGALLDVGCYPVSYACLIAGRAARAASAQARYTSGGIDEELAGVLRFPGDIVGQVYAGFRAAYRTWLEVLGSEGSLTVPNPFKPGPLETLVLERLGERRAIEVRGSALLFARQIEHFVASVIDGAPATVSLDDSRRTCHALGLLRDAAWTAQVPA
jgi:D-xylose 1-dehydrogenase (NADP+, D-xylono-1,5-lactone-forming)